MKDFFAFHLKQLNHEYFSCSNCFVTGHICNYGFSIHLMLLQNQLIIKLLSEEHLNVEESKLLDKNSLTLSLSFIAEVIEKYLTNVRFITNVAK